MNIYTQKNNSSDNHLVSLMSQSVKLRFRISLSFLEPFYDWFFCFLVNIQNSYLFSCSHVCKFCVRLWLCLDANIYLFRTGKIIFDTREILSEDLNTHIYCWHNQELSLIMFFTPPDDTKPSFKNKNTLHSN